MVEDVPDDVTTSEEEEEIIVKPKPKRTVTKQIKEKPNRQPIFEPEGIKVNFF
jgi:hypothetical protein